MSEHRSLFSERSQRAILWWGIGLALVYLVAFVFLLQQVPLKNPAWSAEQVAQWYVDNQGRIKWGAVLASWSGAFMMPILAVVAVQMARVETGGWKIWSALSLVSGALMSLFLMLPPMFWGVAAYTAPRKDSEVTTLMHELASLTMTTTDQFYIFLWIGVTVIALRPATQLVKKQPVPALVGLPVAVDHHHVRSRCDRVHPAQRSVRVERSAGVLVAANPVHGVDHGPVLADLPGAACTDGRA
jgi:hypothetical protein